MTHAEATDLLLGALAFFSLSFGFLLGAIAATRKDRP